MATAKATTATKNQLILIDLINLIDLNTQKVRSKIIRRSVKYRVGER